MASKDWIEAQYTSERNRTSDRWQWFKGKWCRLCNMNFCIPLTVIFFSSPFALIFTVLIGHHRCCLLFFLFHCIHNLWNMLINSHNKTFICVFSLFVCVCACFFLLLLPSSNMTECSCSFLIPHRRWRGRVIWCIVFVTSFASAHNGDYQNALLTKPPDHFIQIPFLLPSPMDFRLSNKYNYFHFKLDTYWWHWN